MNILSKYKLISTLTLYFSLHIYANCSPIEFHIHPAGNDSWNGMSIEHNGVDTGPFSSIKKAITTIRSLKKNNAFPSDGIIINIHEGIYRPLEPITLTSIDSGSASAKIIYKAYNNQKVVLSGGIIIDNFKLVEDINKKLPKNTYIANLKKYNLKDLGNIGKVCKWPCDAGNNRLELYYDNQLMDLARWPNNIDNEHIPNSKKLPSNKNELQIITNNSSATLIRFKGSKPRDWKNDKNVWLFGAWYYHWADQHVKLETVDIHNNIISLKNPGHRFGYKENQPFFAYNLLSELDQQGEWFLDRKKQELYFLPPDKFDNANVEISILQSIIILDNVSNISFEGIIFEKTRGTAINIHKGNNNVIKNCVIRNTGSKGIEIRASNNSGIKGCEIFNTGNSAIHIESGNRIALTSGNNFVINNNIHNYARWITSYQPGISTGGVGAIIKNNEIHDAPNQAIWFKGNDHIISNNEIYNVCTNSNDAGAIYAGADWTMRGTVIKNNYFHDIVGLNNDSASGVYLDDMFSGTVVEGNLFNNVRRPIIIGGGRDNIIKNNIFIQPRTTISLDDRGLNSMKGAVHSGLKHRLSLVPYKSKPWIEKYPKLENIWEDNPGAPKGNIIEGNINIGKRWIAMRKEAAKYTIIRENFLDVDPTLFDATNSKFNITPEKFKSMYGYDLFPIRNNGIQ